MMSAVTKMTSQSYFRTNTNEHEHERTLQYKERIFNLELRPNREAGETLGSRKGRMRIPGNESHVSGITHEDKNQDGGRRNTNCNSNVLSALYLSLSITDTKEKTVFRDVC